MINVAKTYLPPIEDYIKLLKQVWKTRMVTNGGVFEKELTDKLRKYLNVKHFVFITNATVGLQVAIKVLELKDEVITTPFSYVATTSSLVWEKCKPVFVDINPETLCIDSSKIENAITKKTSGIVATHVYGNPCNVLNIKKIAKVHKLKVIYDAAHSFGVKYRGKGMGEYGDVSVFSFHATKVFHTVQGGGISASNGRLAKKLNYTIRFGHKTPVSFHGLGINGRNSELHAIIGLCQLHNLRKFFSKRRKIAKEYKKQFKDLPLSYPRIRQGTTDYNYSYFPVIFENERQLLLTTNFLMKNNIFPRRYFFPSLDTLSYVKSPAMKISRDIARRVLCLPIYYELSLKNVRKISRIIRKSFKIY